MNHASLRKLLLDLNVHVIVHHDRLELSCDKQSLRGKLFSDLRGNSSSISARLNISVPVSLRKRGHGLRLILLPGGRKPHERLVKLMVQAQAARAQLFGKRDISKARSCDQRRMIRLARLSYLAPDIVISILNGQQPEEITCRRLRQMRSVPVSWSEQRRLLGFPDIAETDEAHKTN
jgi:hypothetical protein